MKLVLHWNGYKKKWKMKTKPKNCVYPNCQNCVYKDCIYDRLEVDDYTESNERDYELYEAATGKKYHKGKDKEYRIKRQTAYTRKRNKERDRSEYNKMYYKKHRTKILEKAKENYDTKTNTKMCRRYRKRNLEKRKEYEKQYYELHKEEKKRKARERYYAKKLEMQRA
jgi:hypothetical protein